MSNNIRILSGLFNTLRSRQSTTLREYRVILEKTFKSADVSEEKTSADLILAAVIGRKTLSGVDPDLQLTHEMLDRVKEMTVKRLERIPVQYIIKEWDFCHLTFSMQQPVFIPRPETEELVGLALQDSVVQNAENFLEVGCGSGVISTVLLKLLPKASCTVVDVNPAACLLTKRNSMLHNLSERMSVINTSWKDYVTNESTDGRHLDFLISNPPYISTSDMDLLQPEVQWFEDRRALHGGVDGMDTIKEILTYATHLLKPHGSLWLEVDLKHPEMVQRFVEENKNCKLKYVASHKDFTGRLRFCHLSAVE